jgi:hypothetical protein
MMTRVPGVSLVVAASLLGLVIACYDFVTPDTGIDHSGGVELVIISTALMLCAAAAAALIGSRLLAGILIFLIVLDIAGTGTAAWFLESWLMMAAMALVALGLISHARARRTAP